MCSHGKKPKDLKKGRENRVKAMKKPGKVTKKEIKTLAASALTQAPDKKKKSAPKKKPKKKGK